jgi:hypothetical protein
MLGPLQHSVGSEPRWCPKGVEHLMDFLELSHRAIFVLLELLKFLIQLSWIWRVDQHLINS